MRRRSSLLALAVPCFAVLLLGTCKLDSPSGPAPAPTVDSTTTVVGNGSIRTFVTLDNAGAPTAVGAIFTEGLLTNLPTSNTAFTLGFGANAAKTPFTHMFFDWAPFGHAPGAIYDRPHLDFHFYFASVQDRLAVAAGVDSTPPGAATLPTNYFKVTESVAFMGTHFADSTFLEFHGTPFDKTLLYGSHEGRITFYDLMTTTAWLVTKPSVLVAIGQPATYPKSGYYPTQYRVSYDAVTREYRVAVEGFVLH
jgi:hypothetical protein